MTSIKLTDLAPGKQAVLADFKVSRLHQRMLSMGFTPGTMVRVMRRIPWQGNLYVEIGGRNLALRFQEAEQIIVNVSQQ